MGRQSTFVEEIGLMSTTLDVDSIFRQAGPVLHQHGHEIQPACSTGSTL
jgi:hypothetical protein